LTNRPKGLGTKTKTIDEFKEDDRCRSLFTIVGIGGIFILFFRVIFFFSWWHFLLFFLVFRLRGNRKNFWRRLLLCLPLLSRSRPSGRLLGCAV
jgi:hypothetical protein